MTAKSGVRGPGTVFNGTLIERLRARAIAVLTARLASRQRDARDRAVSRPVDHQNIPTR